MSFFCIYYFCIIIIYFLSYYLLFILFYFILFYFILFYFILFYFILLFYFIYFIYFFCFLFFFCFFLGIPHICSYYLTHITELSVLGNHRVWGDAYTLFSHLEMLSAYSRLQHHQRIKKSLSA